MVNRTMGAFVLLALAAAGCETHDPLYCDEDTPCDDPDRPFCDIEGTYPASEGHGRTCIPEPTFELMVAEGDVFVRTDAQVELEAEVVRTDEFPDEITLTVEGLPDGALAEPITLAVTETSTTIVIDSGTAEAGSEGPISIVATAGDRERSQDLRLVVLGPPGSLDPTFGSDGISVEPQNDLIDSASSLVLLEDGSFVVVGSADPFDSHFFSRFDADGSIDPALGQDGIVVFDWDSAGLEGVGGSPRAARQTADRIIMADVAIDTLIVGRFTRDGALDTTFGDGGTVVEPPSAQILNRVAVGPMDEIIVATSFTEGPQQVRLRRYSADGEPDATFGGGAVDLDQGTSNSVIGLSILEDRSVVGTGIATDGATQVFVFRLTAQGAPDPDFGTEGIFVLDDATSVRAVLPQPDGTFVVSGQTAAETAMWRLTASGQLDDTFGDGGVVLYPQTEGVRMSALLDDAGAVLGVGGSSEFVMIRFDPTSGALDSSFGTDGIASLPMEPPQFFQGAGLLADFRYLVLGDPDGPDSFVLARFFR